MSNPGPAARPLPEAVVDRKALMRLEAQPGLEPGYETVPRPCVAIPPPGRTGLLARTAPSGRLEIAEWLSAWAPDLFWRHAPEIKLPGQQDRRPCLDAGGLTRTVDCPSVKVADRLSRRASGRGLVVNPMFSWVTAMSDSKAASSSTKDRSDWNRAWDVVSGLAAARGTTMREIDDRPRAAPVASAMNGPIAAPHAAPVSRQPFAPIAPDQLARDIAEIEKAAAALRSQEPALEMRYPDVETIGELRPARSVWMLITTIWISAVLVVSGAIGALALLFG